MIAGGLRLGVIGAGRWGRNIIATLRQIPGVRVSCVASRRPEVRGLVDNACAVEPDWRDLLRRGNIDAVAVATPPATHAEITAEAVRAGLPVFVEKPLTGRLDEAERLLDLVSRLHGYVLVDHVHLFSHAYRALRRRLPDIAPLRRIRAEAGAWGPFRPDTPVLWDWGPHEAAFYLDLVGTLPLAVSARRVERRRVHDVWGETLTLGATYPDAVSAEASVSNLLDRKCRSLLLEGGRGSLLYDDRAEPKLVYRPAGTEAGRESVAAGDEPPLFCALTQFIENVTRGGTTLDDLRFGVGVVRMLDAWQRALE